MGEDYGNEKRREEKRRAMRKQESEWERTGRMPSCRLEISEGWWKERGREDQKTRGIRYKGKRIDLRGREKYRTENGREKERENQIAR